MATGIQRNLVDGRTITYAEIEAFNLSEYWRTAQQSDPIFPDDDTIRNILRLQGFYS